MRKLLFILVFFIALGTWAQPEATFGSANEAFQQEDYQKAISLYDSIVNQGYIHPETYYNLGNAHYRLGNVGLAILNYERALKLNPSDEDAQHNLALAQQLVVDEFNVVPTPPLKRLAEDISGLVSETIWTVLALCAFLAAAITALLFLLKKRTSFVLIGLIISLLVATFFEVMAYSRNIIDSELFAVITASNTYVKSAPANTASDLYILHEGTKVKVQETFDAWQKIKLPDGKIGWVETADLEDI